MGEKSEKKRRFILERAETVFAKKGYKAVTMKDIVDACEISRGGLYLYFSCVREVFEAVLKAEDTGEGGDGTSVFLNTDSESSASELLALFIKLQKREVFRKQNNLTLAIYEYFNEVASDNTDNEFKKSFQLELRTVEDIVNKGILDGEFECEDPAAWARNFLFVINSMKMNGKLLGITEPMFDREMLYVLSQLVIEYYDEDPAQPQGRE